MLFFVINRVMYHLSNNNVIGTGEQKLAEMTVYDELVARGLIAQVTDEELIKI